MDETGVSKLPGARKVLIKIFKPWGTYKYSGEYETTKEHIFQILEEVTEMALQGNIPGIVKDSCWTSEPWQRDWILHVEVPDHPQNYPNLIPLARDGQGKRVWASSAWYEQMQAAMASLPTPADKERQKLKDHGIEYH